MLTFLSSAGVPSQSQPPICGTGSLDSSLQHRRLRFSGSVLRLSFHGAPTLTESADTPSSNPTVDLAVTALFRTHDDDDDDDVANCDGYYCWTSL